MLNVVIFGSAAADATRRTAADVDVAYSGSMPDRPARAEAAAMADEWADEHGLGHLPLDIHHAPSYHAKTEVMIPSPCGVDVPAIPLTAWTKVRPVPYHTVSAAVRAYGHRRALLARWLPVRDRLTVIPASSATGPDWEGYTQGLTALRRAVAKAPHPGQVEQALADWYGPLMSRLLAEDPRPTPAGLERLRAGSPVAAGGAVLVVLGREGGPQLEYDALPAGAMEALLYP